MKLLQNFLLLLLYSLSESYFTKDFREFLVNINGAEIAELLERVDLRENGSFGGKIDGMEKLKNQPVILVHGVMSDIMRFFPIKHFYHRQGYSEGEIYGTTWGNPDDLLINVTLKCAYVKQLRAFFESVHKYTKKKVDVLGYSMGSVLARKAILGGNCEGELGEPLTKIVDTFVSVAGSNYGSSYCDEYSYFDVCNPTNGLSCDSEFLKELNSYPKRFEGRFSFAIASNFDEKVGEWCCGKKCCALLNSNREFWGYESSHDRLMIGSARLQFELITKHRRIKAKLIVKRKKSPQKFPFSFNNSNIERESAEENRNSNIVNFESISDSMKSQLLESFSRLDKERINLKGTMDYEDLVKEKDFILKNQENSIKVVSETFPKTMTFEDELPNSRDEKLKPNNSKKTSTKPLFSPLSLLFGKPDGNDFSFGISGGPSLKSGKIDSSDGKMNEDKADELQKLSSGIIGEGGRGPGEFRKENESENLPQEEQSKEQTQEVPKVDRDHPVFISTPGGIGAGSELDKVDFESPLETGNSAGEVIQESEASEAGITDELFQEPESSRTQKELVRKRIEMTKGMNGKMEIETSQAKGGQERNESPFEEIAEKSNVLRNSRVIGVFDEDFTIESQTENTFQEMKRMGIAGVGHETLQNSDVMENEVLKMIAREGASQFSETNSKNVQIVHPRLSTITKISEKDLMEKFGPKNMIITRVEASELQKNELKSEKMLKNLIIKDLPDKVIEIDTAKRDLIEMPSQNDYAIRTESKPIIHHQKRHSTHKLPIKKFKRRKVSHSSELQKNVDKSLKYKMKKQKRKRLRKTRRSARTSKGKGFEIHQYPIVRIERLKKQRSTGKE